jgi:ketosteroid isomerase-like protein
MSKYDNAFNRHDAAAVAALYTEDAVYATRHGAYHGRRAIEKGSGRITFPVNHGRPDRLERPAMITTWEALQSALIAFTASA